MVALMRFCTILAVFERIWLIEVSNRGQMGSRIEGSISCICVHKNGCVLMALCSAPQNQRRPSAWPGHVAFQMHRGQSVTSCVGAYAFNRAPLLLDLTDGNVHHLLQIHDEELVVWESLTPQQAYVKQAEVLQEMSRLHPGPALRRLGNIPEEEQVPMKKCRGLRPSSGLAEQLESVVPFMPDHERVSCAREIITAKLHIP